MTAEGGGREWTVVTDGAGGERRGGVRAQRRCEGTEPVRARRRVHPRRHRRPRRCRFERIGSPPDHSHWHRLPRQRKRERQDILITWSTGTRVTNAVGGGEGGAVEVGVTVVSEGDG